MRWPWQRRDHGATRPEHPPSPPVVVAPPAPMGWAFLPPLQRQVAEMPLVTRPAVFPSDLPAWRNPSLTGTLGHRSSADAPSGIIDADGGGAAAPQVRTEPVDLTLLAPEPVHSAPVQRATVVPTDPTTTGSPSPFSTGTGSTSPQASLTTAAPAHLPVLAVTSYDTTDEEPPDIEAVPADERPATADDTAEASLATPMDAVAPPHIATPQVQRSVAGETPSTPPRAAMPLVPTPAPTAAGGRRLGLGAPLPAMPPATEVPAVQRSASPWPPLAGEGAEGYVEVDIPITADRAETPSTPGEEADAPTLGADPPDRLTTEIRGTSDHLASRSQMSAPALPLPAVQRSSVGGPDEGSGARPGSASPSTAPTHPGESPVVDRPDPGEQTVPADPVPEPSADPVQRAAESAPTAPTLGARSTPAPASGEGAADTAARGVLRTAGPALHLQRSVVPPATSGTDVVDPPQPAGPVGTTGDVDAPRAARHLRPARTGDLALQRSLVLDAPGTGPGAPGDGEPAGELPPPGPVAATEAPDPRRDPTSQADLATPAAAAAPSRPTLAMHGPVTTLTTTVQRLVPDATGPHQAVHPSSPSALRAPSTPRADRSAGDPVWAPAQLPTLQRLASLPGVPGLPRVPSVPGPGMPGGTPTLPALPDAAPALPTAPPLPMAPTLPTAPAVPGLPVTPAPAGPATGSPWADQGLPMPLVTPTPAAAETAITPTPSAVQETPATAPETAVPPESDSRRQEAAEPGAPANASGSGAGPGAGPAAGASSPEQLEALAQRLFSPLMRRIRAEMLLDRERRGLRTDSW